MLYWKSNNIGPLQGLRLRDIRCHIIARQIVWTIKCGDNYGVGDLFIDDVRFIPRSCSGFHTVLSPARKQALALWAVKLWPATRMEWFGTHSVYFWLRTLEQIDSDYVVQILKDYHGYTE